MSIRLMYRVWDNGDTRLKDTKLVVLLAMADYADDVDECEISLEFIAHKARVSERQVTRTLGWLKDNQFITLLRPGAGRSSALYKIQAGQ